VQGHTAQLVHTVGAVTVLQQETRHFPALLGSPVKERPPLEPISIISEILESFQIEGNSGMLQEVLEYVHAVASRSINYRDVLGFWIY
jgi:hypothetical protein